jgi:PIN domain nuclease of toxin-antitoxin system
MITVDTHIIIWQALDPQKLSHKAILQFKEVNDSDGLIFCHISLWENN